MEAARKGIAILGSTGTIGSNALAVVRQFPQRFQVLSLAAGRNLDLLRAQIREFRPKQVAVMDGSDAKVLASEFPEIEFGHGDAGLNACLETAGVQVVVVGIVGFAALSPTLHAISLGLTVALANKETLVAGGSLLKREIAKSRATIIPVDSEHNALYQLLKGHEPRHVRTIALTASGGPLLKRPDIPLEDVTPAMAVAHPNWRMGPKISVDSATLMNKGLELIEAHFLFDFPQERIEVWVHPQSIVHGALWLVDNSCLAQLTRPDMRSSIGYAMEYPDRLPDVIEKLCLSDMSRLEFLEPDLVRFPALRLAREALDAGPSHLIALNAANEVAVGAFLEGKLLFPGIPAVVAEVLTNHASQRVETVESIFRLDREARRLAGEAITRRKA